MVRSWLSTLPTLVNEVCLILGATWMIHQEISFQVGSAGSKCRKTLLSFFTCLPHLFPDEIHMPEWEESKTEGEGK